MALAARFVRRPAQLPADAFKTVETVAARGLKHSLCVHARGDAAFLERAGGKMAPQYLTQHRTHRGALWASGAAQAAHVVRIILRFSVSYRVLLFIVKPGKPASSRAAPLGRIDDTGGGVNARSDFGTPAIARSHLSSVRLWTSKLPALDSCLSDSLASRQAKFVTRTRPK